MKAKDALRVHILSVALGELSALRKAMTCTKPSGNWDRHGTMIRVGDIGQGHDDNPANCNYEVELDNVTAGKLVPKIRQLILAEMKELGVEP